MPAPQMPMQNGMMTMQEFRDQFAHGHRYGMGRVWPSVTILFYRLIGPNYYTRPWRKHLNLHGRHAEEFMKDELEEFMIGELRSLSFSCGTYTLEIVLNYSPCWNCSLRLKQTKDSFQNTGNNLRITIKTSSFYKTYDRPNIDGLVDLVKENIVLKIFDGKRDWVEFLSDVIGVQECSLDEWLAIPLTEERRAREYIDRFILKGIYDCSCGKISVDDLYKMGSNPY